MLCSRLLPSRLYLHMVLREADRCACSRETNTCFDLPRETNRTTQTRALSASLPSSEAQGKQASARLSLLTTARDQQHPSLLPRARRRSPKLSLAPRVAPEAAQFSHGRWRAQLKGVPERWDLLHSGESSSRGCSAFAGRLLWFSRASSIPSFSLSQKLKYGSTQQRMCRQHHNLAQPGALWSTLEGRAAARREDMPVTASPVPHRGQRAWARAVPCPEAQPPHTPSPAPGELTHSLGLSVSWLGGRPPPPSSPGLPQAPACQDASGLGESSVCISNALK